LIHVCSIRDITKKVAAAVIKEAIDEDLAEGYREMDARELRKLNKVYSSIIGKTN
jgi:malate dehydrogenase (decarboxylating)